MIHKKIKSLNVQTKQLPQQGEARAFSILGDSGAAFVFQVVNASNQFYNFTTNLFQNGCTPQTLLKSSISGSAFNGLINFPSSGSSYNLILIADPSDVDSVLDLPKGNGVINKKINQVSNSTVSFSLVTSNTSNYTTLPTLSNVEGSPLQSLSQSIDRDFTVTNVSNDSHGFGLKLDRQPLSSTDFVFRKTQTVNGATSSSFTVVLDSVTDISVGMVLTGVSSGSLTGTPVVKAVDTKTLTISLSSAQSLADGITLTFDAIGVKGIANATGLVFDVTPSAKAAGLTKLVRTAISNSTTINVEGTYGIGVGATFNGSDVDNSSANTVQSVSASSTAGSFVCQVNQTLEENQKISIKGTSQSIDLTNAITINKFPSSNTTISILLDNFITPGVGS